MLNILREMCRRQCTEHPCVCLQMAVQYVPAISNALQSLGVKNAEAALLGVRRLYGQTLADQFKLLAGFPIQGNSWWQRTAMGGMWPLLICTVAGAIGTVAVLGFAEVLPMFLKGGTAFPSKALL